MTLQGRFDGDEENPGRSSPSDRPRHRLSPSAPPTIDMAPMLHGFTIDWTPPNSPVPITGYRVYRREGEGHPRIVSRLPATVHSFLDLDVEPGHRYSYSVAAINFLGEGSPSEEVVGSRTERGLAPSSG